MDLEQFQFTVAEFKAIEVYPFAEKIQRYFTAIHDNHAGAVYRIIAYPHKLIQVEPLLAALGRLRELSHPLLTPIAHIFPEAELFKNLDKTQSQKVVAVVLQQVPNAQVLSCFDFIMRVGPISETMSKYFMWRLLSLIQYMQQQGFNKCLAPEDIFINCKTGEITLDTYGDRQFFKVKNEPLSDLWELGSFLFTCLKTIPPYQNKLAKDPHFNCLLKGQFQKFWSLFSSQPICNPSEEAISFLNVCFTQGKSVQELKAHPWLHDYTPLSSQQADEELCRIKQAKNQAKAQQNSDKRARKQKIMKSIRERNNFAPNRSAFKDELIDHFLQKLCEQEAKKREINNKNKEQASKEIQIAYLLTQLSFNNNEDIKITDLKDLNDTIRFKVKAELEDNMNIDSDVELDLSGRADGLPFRFGRITGSLYESLWVCKYIAQLCLEI